MLAKLSQCVWHAKQSLADLTGERSHALRRVPDTVLDAAHLRFQMVGEQLQRLRVPAGVTLLPLGMLALRCFRLLSSIGKTVSGQTWMVSRPKGTTLWG